MGVGEGVARQVGTVCQRLFLPEPMGGALSQATGSPPEQPAPDLLTMAQSRAARRPPHRCPTRAAAAPGVLTLT